MTRFPVPTASCVWVSLMLLLGGLWWERGAVVETCQNGVGFLWLQHLGWEAQSEPVWSPWALLFPVPSAVPWAPVWSHLGHGHRRGGVSELCPAVDGIRIGVTLTFPSSSSCHAPPGFIAHELVGSVCGSGIGGETGKSGSWIKVLRTAPPVMCVSGGRSSRVCRCNSRHQWGTVVWPAPCQARDEDSSRSWKVHGVLCSWMRENARV